MRSLYRVTLEMPEMDSTGQSAPIRVSLTSSRLKELLIGQVLEIHACNNPSPVFKRCILSAVASTSSQGVCQVR
jgi:TusA-related sulfurtransferase